ncbi:MAG TPA: L,D-transpeptidase [Candidatus Limiplasma sp.]|nr:L,D-transpeptidase [Candidatus Limiplasma sp.]
MKSQPAIKRMIVLLIVCTLIVGLIPLSASAKTLEGWLDGFETGKDYWFPEDFQYDITDAEACWEIITRPITVLKGDYEVYPLTEPGGKKVNTDKLGGYINPNSSAVNVLGEDEDGWTLIEGMDYLNRIIKGYVKTSLLEEVTPSQHIGLIVDKLNQTLYVFIDGELFSSCAVSTGLASDSQPYNETSAGEYLIWSRTGEYDAEGMLCSYAMRYNGGDMIHEVPHLLNADGTSNYNRYGSLLGTKASHGCIRVENEANEDGLDAEWLWDNLKSYIYAGTYPKIVIWDDAGREQPYPDDDMPLYYNPNGGKYYHSDQYCSSVKDRYLPLTEFTYGELDDEPYASLTPCPYCCTVMRKDEIDLDNLERGAITQEEYDERQAARHAAETQDETTDEGTNSGSAAAIEDIVITISTVSD